MVFKKLLFFLLISIIMPFLNGCWNYREIEQVDVVIGFAVDRDRTNKEILLTVEIARPTIAERQSKFSSEIYESRGTTMFEAMRDLIIKTGRKPHWSHANIIIISKEIAEDGINEVFDMLYRDQEIRKDSLVLVSKEKTAGEIFEAGHSKDIIRTDQLSYAIKNQRDISKFPESRLYEVIENLASKDSVLLLTTVETKSYPDRTQPEVFGSAILKYDKVIGYLNGEETQYALWARGDLKGGILIVRDVLNSGNNISLQVFSAKTKLKPQYGSSNIGMKINIRAYVSIAEVSGDIAFYEEETKNKLRDYAEATLGKQLKFIIKKAQVEYESDIFKFGNKIRIDNPRAWKQVESNWSSEFTDMNVEVSVELDIKGSSLMSRPIKGGAK